MSQQLFKSLRLLSISSNSSHALPLSSRLRGSSISSMEYCSYGFSPFRYRKGQTTAINGECCRPISTHSCRFKEYLVTDELPPSSPYSKSPLSNDVNREKRFEGWRRRDTPFAQKLMFTKTPEEVLRVLELETEAPDVISTTVAVDALFDALRNERSLPVKTKHHILTSVGGQKLFKLVSRYSSRMDPGDLISCVKLLSFLCAPGNHYTLQILLKLLSKHANNLDLQQLAYMQFLLDKLHPESKSSLSKALEFALPVVFESKLTTELDRKDPHGVCDYLHYATKYKLSDKSINFLVETALRITDKFSHASAKSILWSLCDTEFNDRTHEPLVTWCFRKLTEFIDEFKLPDLATTMGKVARKYNCFRAPYFYNEDFMNAYCQKNCQSDIDPEYTLWSVKTVSTLRHVNIELLDRVGEIIATRPSYVLNNDKLFFAVVKAFANLNYKPEKWSTFSSILLEHPALTKTYSTQEVLLVIQFLSLDLFPEKIIQVLYSPDGLPILEEYAGRFRNPFPLVLMYNAIKTLYPNYKGPMPPVSMIEQWKEASRASHANKSYPLKSALQTGLGGESYVINGLFHDGIHIDHGIVMRKGGYPVAVNSQSDSQLDCLSSITKPPESLLILIKVWSEDYYANNTRRLRGGALLEQKIIESLGHPVVVVDQKSWMELSDHEKIPYLMQKIREKMEKLQWNQNWGDVIPP